jgi:hypothetical protein
LAGKAKFVVDSIFAPLHFANNQITRRFLAWLMVIIHFLIGSLLRV